MDDVIFVPNNESPIAVPVENQEVYFLVGPDPTVPSKNIQLASYMAYVNIQLEKRKIVWDEANKTTLAGFLAYKIPFENSNGRQGILFALVKDGSPYAISYVGSTSKFDQYLPTIQKMLLSLKFL